VQARVTHWRTPLPSGTPVDLFADSVVLILVPWVMYLAMDDEGGGSSLDVNHPEQKNVMGE
jgi:hypothetical protein